MKFIEHRVADRRARTDLGGGRSAMVVPTATAINLFFELAPTNALVAIDGAPPGLADTRKQSSALNSFGGRVVYFLVKMDLGIMQWTPLRMSTTWETRQSPAFVVSSVLQLSPAQSASRIPKPCDWLRKIRAHAVQTVQQWLALTEENRRQREMHGVDQLLGLYMLGAGVPSDHLVTPTRKTDSGGKDLSCG
jgi:hypothetical protein